MLGTLEQAFFINNINLHRIVYAGYGFFNRLGILRSAINNRHGFCFAFSEHRSHLTRAAEGARTPGQLAREALAADLSLDDRNRAVELVKQGDVGPWPPDPEALRPLL